MKKKKNIKTQGGLWEALLNSLLEMTVAVATAKKGKKR